MIGLMRRVRASKNDFIVGSHPRRRASNLPDPRATLQTSLTRINYFVERNGRDAAEGGIVHLAYIRFLHPDQRKGEKFYTTIWGRKCRG